jgi:hypothetical protein
MIGCFDCKIQFSRDWELVYAKLSIKWNLQELFSGEGQSKMGRRGINEVTMCVCVCIVHSSIIMHIRVLYALLIVTDIDLNCHAADAPSSKHLPKIDVYFYSNEFGTSFSLS